MTQMLTPIEWHFRYIKWIIAFIFISALYSQGIAQNPVERVFLTIAVAKPTVKLDNGKVEGLPQAQDTKPSTGKDLLKLITYPEKGVVYSRSSYYIRDTYAARLANGEVPDWRTVYGLVQLVKEYLTKHESELAGPAEALVLEALKDAPARIRKERAYFNKAIEATKGYYSDPIPENARKLFAALPDGNTTFLDAAGEDLLIECVFAHLQTLAKDIKAGDPNAVDVAFRLFYTTDGAYSEVLSFILGETLVPNHPRLFLQKMLEYGPIMKPWAFVHLEGILLMTAEFGEIPEAGNDPKKYEEISQARLKRRIQALESVEDPALEQIRNRCLKILKEHIDWT